jgi:hypothetical protein
MRTPWGGFSRVKQGLAAAAMPPLTSDKSGLRTASAGEVLRSSKPGLGAGLLGQPSTMTLDEGFRTVALVGCDCQGELTDDEIVHSRSGCMHYSAVLLQNAKETYGEALARLAAADAREAAYWDARAAREGGWPSPPPHPSPTYEPLMYDIDGHMVNILDGCDCERFSYGDKCRHYEAALEEHHRVTERG